MKDEYNLLNNAVIDFSQYEIEEISEFEKKRMMKKFIDSKNIKTFWNKKKISIVAVALLFAVSLGMNGNRALAVVTSLKFNIETWLGVNNKGEKYSTEIGKTLEAKGTKITLNEFFIDNSRIIINLNVNKGQDDVHENYLKLIPDIYVNGKKVERSSDYVGRGIGQIDENNEESNVMLDLDGKDISLNNKDEVKLVFANLAKECGASDSDFAYRFDYDSTSYKNSSKVINVDKSIKMGENELYLGNITVKPDRVLISGSSKGFSPWENSKDANYYYDIVDENNNSAPLKEEIGKGSYFYRDGSYFNRDGKDITTLKVIPYTFNKIDTGTTAASFDGRTKYIYEDKIITINFK